MVPDFNPKNPDEVRHQKILQSIQSLVHACQCLYAECQLPACQKMKRVVMHSKICKRRTKGNCPICKQLIALCCYHGKHCHDDNCRVPFCEGVKLQMMQQE